MRRRRKSANRNYTVNLFPFLAVLICTMGILVALLVVAVQAADSSAREKAEEDRKEALEQVKLVQDQLDENQLRLEGLQSFRPDVVARVKEMRQKRAHVQADLQSLDEQANALAQQLKQLEQQPSQTKRSVNQLDASIEILKQQILSAEEHFAELQKQKPVENTVYSIVPTDSGGTTNRRPIYLECVQNQIIIQPHGIAFRVGDFAPPIQVGNPLDAAMLAVREYWNKYQLSGAEGDAYPLLVVRPSGARAYALARHAIQSWDDEFGYELIEEDLELDFGARDTRLEQEVGQAIAAAKLRQQQRMQALARSGQQSRQAFAGGSGNAAEYTGLTADRANGGFSYQGAQASAQQANARVQPDAQQTQNAANSRRSFGARGASETAKSRDPNQDPNRANSPTQGAEGGAAIGNTTDSLASSRGKDWALPSRTDGGTAYRRPIGIHCFANRLIVESGASLGNRQQEIPMELRTQDAIDPLVDVVWRMIDSWGFAGTGGYWKPELRIQVHPGGDNRARELARLLGQSGLDIQLSQPR